MAASIKIPAQFTAIDKFSNVVGKMAAGTKKFATTGVAAVKRFDTRVTATFNKLGRISQLALGLGLGGLFIAAADGVKTYEDDLVGVSKTTGLVGKSLADFSNNVLQTSKDLRGVSSSKLLELGQSAGQLGVKGSDNILRFATTMAKLEKASDIHGEEGAAKIARLLTITGEGIGDIDRFASAIVGLGNDYAAVESEILGVASEISRSTAAYGLQSKGILGLSAAMKSLDVRPEAAGTAVGKVFRGIEMATIKGGKSLKAYSNVIGLSSKETKELFANDSQTAFIKLIGGLNSINNNGGSVAKTLADLGLNGETVSKGIIPLATNFKLLNNAITDSSNLYKANAAVNDEFNSSTKTVNTALQDIKDEFNNVFIATATAGSGLGMVRDTLFFVADNMESVVAVGAGLLATFGLMKAIVWGAQIAMVAYNIALGIQGAVSGAASIAIGQNAIALGAYRTAMAIGTAGTWLATAATTAFGVAINLGIWPITLIVAAIAGLIALFYNWDSVTAWFGKQWGRFTAFIGGAWDAVVGWFKEFDFMAFFKNIGQSILKFMLTPMKTMLGLLARIPGKIGKFASFGLDKINDLTGENEINVNNAIPLNSPELNQAKSDHATREAMIKGGLNINLSDPGKMIESISPMANTNLPILTATQGRS